MYKKLNFKITIQEKLPLLLGAVVIIRPLIWDLIGA